MSDVTETRFGFGYTNRPFVETYRFSGYNMGGPAYNNKCEAGTILKGRDEMRNSDMIVKHFDRMMSDVEEGIEHKASEDLTAAASSVIAPGEKCYDRVDGTEYTLVKRGSGLVTVVTACGETRMLPLSAVRA